MRRVKPGTNRHDRPDKHANAHSRTRQEKRGGVVHSNWASMSSLRLACVCGSDHSRHIALLSLPDLVYICASTARCRKCWAQFAPNLQFLHRLASAGAMVRSIRIPVDSGDMQAQRYSLRRFTIRKSCVRIICRHAVVLILQPYGPLLYNYACTVSCDGTECAAAR